ncbi:PTS fructose transporter subunit IIABC [Lacrimispora algidixylanolytica]|uniref:PTS fructose transporter subunit IIC n=1 Tax=Lacrimispora algidixylanolytica TaxID=94868 RepID=A0A419STW8_9FIRM|nr:fructose-specific PTS transporter subunit EIIC [Lacrimispora algidixylanolytica]RKD28727.1 PTS fructose transporter subunit IIC [Lacrimispora algidixylanolytica]
MKITELLKKESVELHVKVSGKESAIDRLVDLMGKGGRLNDKAVYKEEILKREAHGSTAVGEGIAIPHAKTAAVKEAGLAAMVVPEGVDYEAFDGVPAKLIFMIAAPEGGADLHLEALSRLSTLLMDTDFREDLMNAQSKEEFLKLIDDKESMRYQKNTVTKSDGYRVLAVTACPTGIAHTFMAAESLEQSGKKLGIPLKAETNGAEGIGNALTKEEIEAADGIIIAADKNVDMARFEGKRVVMATVSEGIQKGEELIKRAVSGEAAVYHYTGSSSSESSDGESVGRSIYKHLMNGVSHMLPFVIGGGILIALAFLFDDFSIDPSNFGKNTPLAAYLKTIGEQAFGMMLPVLAGYIAMSIADRPGLAVGFVGGLIAKMGSTFANPAGGSVNSGFLGALLAGFIGGYIVLMLKRAFKKLPKSLEGIKPVLLYPLIGILLVAVATTFINPFVGAINDGITGLLNNMGGTSKIVLGAVVGGMMSVDMGGPVNKAAYVFGTAQLAEGNFDIMAAVMAGGMVPPIAIALCTTFFKKKFTDKERQSGLVNYIMGLSFISEGAIPFAAADPIRVIPSCMIGSAVAGSLSMAFNCTLRAPHGGIFVLPTIGNPFGYLAAVVIGSVVGCAVLAALKKNLKAE